MSEFSRRDLLSTAVAAGAAMTASTTNAADQIPEPSRAPGVGGSDPVPGDVAREAQNPDLINPPATDSGTLPNLRFSFADAHVRQSSGGWTRQVTVRELAISKPIAGVDMRLNAGGIRELHWHKQAEWAYMLYGTARITAIDPHGRNFVDDVGVGDLWYFPGGIPHSIQGLARTGANSCSSSTMATSTRTIRFCSATGSSTYPRGLGQELRRPGDAVRAHARPP